MQAIFVGVLENEEGSNSASLYQMPDGEYRVWVKMGIGLLEIKADQIDELLFYLEEMKTIINSEIADGR